MDKIIAFVDGSIYSASVCEHAAWIAGRTGAIVDLTHVLGRREASATQDLSGAIALGARSSLLDQLAELDAQRARLVAHRGRAILEDGKAILVSAGVQKVTTRLRHGDLLETLAESEDEADMILIGKRGEAADFAKAHLGSNLERIVRASHKPIYVAARAFKPIKKVLIAFDGGASAIKAVNHIAACTLYANLSMQIVTVGTATPEISKDLDDARATLKSAGIAADISVIAGQPDTVLGKLVGEDHFDMVVMGAYGHSRIRNLVIGSSTTEMIRACKVPLVLVR